MKLVVLLLIVNICTSFHLFAKIRKPFNEMVNRFYVKEDESSTENKLFCLKTVIQVFTPLLLFASTETVSLADDLLISPDQPIQRSISQSSIDGNVKSPLGVNFYDIKVGEGPEVVEGKSVQFIWLLRRSNGYFVAANTDETDPFIYKVGNTKKVIKGIDDAIRGMKAGGIRRMLIPPKLGFVEGLDDGKPGPIPDGFGPKRQILTRLDKEVWYFEIKVLKVK
jgi:hypothetical protein